MFVVGRIGVVVDREIEILLYRSFLSPSDVLTASLHVVANQEGGVTPARGASVHARTISVV